MKGMVGVVVGALLALAIACGGGSKGTADMSPKPRPQTEIDRLDQAIDADMAKLGEPRPAPPVAACVQNCAQAMAGGAQSAKAPDDAATCPPPKSDTCTSSCDLKKSICENASRICSIAADLGGDDGYANDKCNRGLASCDAAKKRCCSCI
jgi:hypothetical protein